jgi:hypothetical protein
MSARRDDKGLCALEAVHDGLALLEQAADLGLAELGLLGRLVVHEDGAADVAFELVRDGVHAEVEDVQRRVGLLAQRAVVPLRLDFLRARISLTSVQGKRSWAHIAEFVVDGLSDLVHAPFDDVDESLEVEVVPRPGRSLLAPFLDLVAAEPFGPPVSVAETGKPRGTDTASKRASMRGWAVFARSLICMPSLAASTSSLSL